MILFNTINLMLMIYFFMVTTAVLNKHDTIKHFANKGKKEGDDDWIEDRNIHLLGGFFAYLTLYFAKSFYNMTFFGNALN